MLFSLSSVEIDFSDVNIIQVSHHQRGWQQNFRDGKQARGFSNGKCIIYEQNTLNALLILGTEAFII